MAEKLVRSSPPRALLGRKVCASRRKASVRRLAAFIVLITRARDAGGKETQSLFQPRAAFSPN